MTTAHPPFETFYEEHKTEVLRFLGRRLGRDRAEDAFQDTFLKALRAYPRLEPRDHLRGGGATTGEPHRARGRPQAEAAGRASGAHDRGDLASRLRGARAADGAAP